MIGSGWHTFVQVGLALARIRDGELFKTEYDSFEAYYRVKWQYGRHYVNRLISAAQVFTHLVTNGHQRGRKATFAAILPMNLKMVALICNELCGLRFRAQGASKFGVISFWLLNC